MILARFLAVALCLGLASGAYGQTPTITITDSTRIPVSVGNFGGARGAESKKLFQTDLALTSMFTLSAGADGEYAIQATATDSGVTGTVTDKNKATVLNQSFQGTWRSATQQFADAVVKKIGGVNGFFTEKVAFVSSQTGSKEVYLMDIDGGALRQLTNDRVISLGPKFSKGGELIAYTSYLKGYADVWIIDLAGGNKRRVSFYPGINSGAAFSPDGSLLALTLSKDGNTELYTISSNGGSPNRLTTTRGTEATPSWSPDGSQIAYVSDDRGSAQIFIKPVSGGPGTLLKTNSTYTTEPAWSPDGKYIAYSIRAGGQSQIGLTVLATGEQKILTKTGVNETPSWTGNSRHLVYANSGRLYVLDSVTGQTIQIDNGLGQNSEPTVSK